MGLITATIVALATLTVTPNIQFTSDSKYTSNKILEVKVQENRDEEQELVSKDLIFTENYVPGYTIYDNPNTPYIDGLKVDDAFVYDWKVENYDDTVIHTVHVKTVFTDDIAGALAAARVGDFSKIIANPLIFIQLLYFSIALIVVIVSAVHSIRMRIKKNVEEELYQKKALALAENLVSPLVGAMKKQQDAILKATILGHSNNPEDHVKMIELLESSATESITDVTESVKKTIIDSANEIKLAKEKSKNTIHQIAKGTYAAEKAATNVGNAVKESIESIKNIGDDGTSI